MVSTVGIVAPRFEVPIQSGKFLVGGPNNTVISGDAVIGTDTAAQILVKLLTVDGTGSGLDSDFFDGQTSAFYQNASNINAGTLADARLPTTMAGKTLTLPVINGMTGTGIFQFGGAGGNGTIEIGRQDGVASGTFIDAHTSAIIQDFNVRLNFSGDVGNGLGTLNVQAGFLQLNSINVLTTAAYDTDGTLAANSDTKIATQKAVKTYCNALIGANDAMVFKGVIDCSANPNYPAADRGWTYRVSVAGKIGGPSGVNVENGDMIICMTDGTVSDTQANVGAQWGIIQLNIDGALTTANIGSSVQAYDSDLAAIAALASPGIMVRSGTGTAVVRAVVGTTNQVLVSNGDGIAGSPTISLDPTIAALGALTITAGSFLRGSAADTFVVQGIIGSVSQSAGAATGSIFEEGTNANGRYVKYASGFMEVFINKVQLTQNSTTRLAATVTLPASFIDAAYCVNIDLRSNADTDGSTLVGAGLATVGTRELGPHAFGSKTTSNFEISQFTSIGATNTFAAPDVLYVSVTARGRWF